MKSIRKKNITHNFNIYSTFLDVEHSLLFNYAYKPLKKSSKNPKMIEYGLI